MIRLKLGCPVCSGRHVLVGVNDLNTVRPDLIKYLVNKNDGEKYREQSNQIISVKCPNCGYTRDMYIYELSAKGFVCHICGDGISYPNKFVRNFLKQLDINYEPEKMFDWLNNRKYDQYLPDYNLIIENHGRQHYEESGIMRSLEEQKEIDMLKRNEAISHGYKYIELNCSESSLECIKQAIMNSELPLLFHFYENDIDWKKCDLTASKSKVIEALEYLNNGMSKKEIAQLLEISSTTLNDYINRLVEMELYVIPERTNNSGPKYGYKKYHEMLDRNFNEKLELFMKCKNDHPELGYLEISKLINIDSGRIRKILVKAYKDNIIDYDITDEIKTNIELKNKNLKDSSRTVYVYDLDYNLVAVYNSVVEASKKMGDDFKPPSIYSTCYGKQAQYKGYHFSYNKIND